MMDARAHKPVALADHLRWRICHVVTILSRYLSQRLRVDYANGLVSRCNYSFRCPLRRPICYINTCLSSRIDDGSSTVEEKGIAEVVPWAEKV